MTPKEKAEDLFLTYFEKQPDYLFNKSEAIRVAKEYALIAVGEILNAIDWDYYEGSNQTEHNYYKEVKKELEKL